MVQIVVKKEQFEELFNILLRVGGKARLIPIADISALSSVLVEKKSARELEFVPMNMPHLEDQRHINTVKRLLHKGHIIKWECLQIPLACELEIPFWKIWQNECQEITCTLADDFLRTFAENHLANGMFTKHEKKIIEDLFKVH